RSRGISRLGGSAGVALGAMTNKAGNRRWSGAASGLPEIDHYGRRAEAACLNRDIHDPNHEPDSTHNFRRNVQVQPNPSAESKPEEWQDDVRHDADSQACGPPDSKLPEGGEIHSHKRHESAEIQQLRRVLITMPAHGKQHSAH